MFRAHSFMHLVGHNLTNYESNLLSGQNLCYRGRGRYFSCQDSRILSHFYTCDIEFDGRVFSSAEQLYQYLKSFFCGNLEICQQILDEKDPVKIKHLGAQCSSTKWDQIKGKVMLCIDKMKIGVCPEVQALLNNSKNMQIYEFVRDDFWGVGNALHLCNIRTFQSKHVTYSFLGRNGRGGENVSGKIWQIIRDEKYPDYVLIGDSIVRGINLPKCMTVSVPGGTFETIKRLTTLLAVLPKKGIILHVGTNDLVDRFGNYAQWANPQNPNQLARILVLQANSIAEKFGIFVVISPILPRMAEKRAQKKIASFSKKLLQQSKKRSEKISILSTYDDFLRNFEQYFSDGLHLSRDGRRILEQIFVDAINNLE